MKPNPDSCTSTAQMLTVEHIRERRRAQRRRLLLMTSITTVAMVLLVWVAVGAYSHFTSDSEPRAISDEAPSNSNGAPSNLTPGKQGVRIPSDDSSKNANLTVTLYYDYDCYGCKLFFEKNSDYLDSLATGRIADVVHMPVAFLTATRADRYSARAMNAAACSLEVGGKSRYIESTLALFESLPGLDDDSRLDDEELIELLARPDSDESAFEDCVNDEFFEGWVRDATDGFTTNTIGMNTVPAVLVNGQQVLGPVIDGEQVQPSAENINSAIDRVSNGQPVDNP